MDLWNRQVSGYTQETDTVRWKREEGDASIYDSNVGMMGWNWPHVD